MERDYERFDCSQSTMINVAWYNSTEKKLVLEYKSGQQYTYDNFDENDWSNFKNAPSKGSFIRESVSSRPYQRSSMLLKG